MVIRELATDAQIVGIEQQLPPRRRGHASRRQRETRRIRVNLDPVVMNSLKIGRGLVDGEIQDQSGSVNDELAA